MRLFGVFVVTIGLSACSRSEATDERLVVETLEDAEKPTTRPIAGAGVKEPTAEPPQKPARTTSTHVPAERPPDRGRVLGGERVEQVETWRSDGDLDVLAQLGVDSREQVARAPAPVLLPPDPRLLTSAKFMVGPTWWSLWTRIDGLTINLQATTITRVHQPRPSRARAARPKPPHEVRGGPGLVTANEDIWSASWTEDGATYTLEVECHDRQMPQCRDGAYVTALAESLVSVPAGDVAANGAAP